MVCKLYINKQYVGNASGLESGFTNYVQCGQGSVIYNPTKIRCNIANKSIPCYRDDNIILGESETFDKLVLIQIRDDNGEELFNEHCIITGVEFDAEYNGKVTDLIKLIYATCE